MKRIGTLGLVLGMVAACSSDDSAANKGTADPAGAAAVVMQTTAMQTSAKNMDGTTLSANVQQVSISGAQQIVKPTMGITVPALPPFQVEPGAVAPAAAPDGVTCDASGCTYTNYMAGGYTYDGSIKSTADGSGGYQIVADLTLKGSMAGQAIDWTIKGDVTVTATSIKGQLGSDGTGTVMGGPGGSISYKYSNLVKYNDVVLTEGKATGGSIYAKWAVEVTGVPQGSQSWEGTVEFK